MRHAWLLPVLLLAVTAARAAHAAPAVVYADAVTWDPQARTLAARGNVELIDAARWVRADMVDVAVDRGLIVARGRVVWQSPDNAGVADAVTMYTQTRTGVFYGAEITGPDGTMVWGRRIEQTGPDSYVVVDGGFTPCACPKQQGEPAWKITVARANVDWRKRVRFRHGAFWFRRFPFLYMPAGIAPLTDSRQTGVLIPGMSYSGRYGFGIEPGLFVALGDHADITLWGEYTTKGGWGLRTEARAASRTGTYKAGYDWFDEADDAPFLADENRTAARRWKLTADIRERPGDLFRLDLDLDLNSDTRRDADFADDIDALTKRTTTSRLTLSEEWDGVGSAWAHVGVSQRLLRGSDSSGSRVPSLWWRADPQRLGPAPVWLSADARYDEFFAYDDSEGDPWAPGAYDHQGRRAVIGVRGGATVDPAPGLLLRATGGAFTVQRSRKTQTVATDGSEADSALPTTGGVVGYVDAAAHWGAVFAGRRHHATVRPGMTALWVEGHDSGEGPVEDIDRIGDQGWLAPGLWAAGSAGTSATRMGWDYAARYPVSLTGGDPDALGVWIHDAAINAGPASLHMNVWQDTALGRLVRWASALTLRPLTGHTLTLGYSEDRGQSPWTRWDTGRPSPFVDDRLPFPSHRELLLRYDWQVWRFFGDIVLRRRLADLPGWVERSGSVGYHDPCNCWRIALHGQDLPAKTADRIELRFELALIGGGAVDF